VHRLEGLDSLDRLGRFGVLRCQHRLGRFSVLNRVVLLSPLDPLGRVGSIGHVVAQVPRRPGERPAGPGELVGKLLYAVTMSVDGFITGPDGDMSWLIPYLGPNPEVDQLITQIGALLVGNRTFGGDDPHKGTEHEGEPFGGGWDGPQFVLTHRPPVEPLPGVTFIDDFDRAVSASKAAAGDKYVNVLGADVARQCLAAGVLDEVLVLIAPVLLGAGVRLFDVPGGSTVRLKRIRIGEVSLATMLWFRVER
jgi:dihydrofolate reductase